MLTHETSHSHPRELAIRSCAHQLAPSQRVHVVALDEPDSVPAPLAIAAAPYVPSVAIPLPTSPQRVDAVHSLRAPRETDRLRTVVLHL